MVEGMDGTTQLSCLRVVDQLRDNPLATLDAALNPRQRSPDRLARVRRHLLQRKSAVLDRAQRITKLMRDRRGDLSHDGIALFLNELILRGAQFPCTLFDTQLERGIGGLRSAVCDLSGLFGGLEVAERDL